MCALVSKYVHYERPLGKRLPIWGSVWTCIECGIVHERENAAINLEKLGLAKPEVTRGDMVPLHPGVSSAASGAAEPQTLTVRTCAHI
jgi:transposase